MVKQRYHKSTIQFSRRQASVGILGGTIAASAGLFLSSPRAIADETLGNGILSMPQTKTRPTFHNPMQDQGRIHTEAVNYVLTQLPGIPPRAKAKQTINDMLEQFFVTKDMKFVPPASFPNWPFPSWPLPKASSSPDLRMIVSRSNISKNLKAATQDLLTLLSAKYDPNAFVKKLDVLNDEVTRNSRENTALGLEKDELNEFYLTTAIAASSALYWTNKGSTALQQLVEKSKHELAPPILKISWRKVAAHDAMGALFGAIDTAISGPGLISGALFGAVASSIEYIVDDFID